MGECGSFADIWCSSYREAALNGQPSAAQIEILKSVSPIQYLKNLQAPTLISQGQADSLFPLVESYRSAAAIKSANPKLPLAMIWHAGGHDGGVDESKFLNQNYLKWFNRHLLGEKLEIPTFQYTNINGSISLQDSTVIPKVFGGEVLPIDGVKQVAPLATPVTALSYPIGGVPTAISALPGIGAASSIAGRVLSNLSGFSPAFLPGQSAFLESAPLEKPLTIIGPSKVKVRITSTSGDATLFFSLVVKSASGAINQPNGIVSPVKLRNIPKSGADVEIELPAVILNAAIGDQLAVGISSTDQGYDLPKDSRFYSISALSGIEYQTVPAKAENTSGSSIIWPAATLLTLILALLFVRIRRPKRDLVAIESDSLVEVVKLGKVYKDGYRAVDDLSFKVERGQVVGLLGPNGAGKTTTLRMLMGLIFPGRENLNLYWKSIGRTGENHLEEVVAITKLGTALDKKVRSYSQGMRQRLAIAQAMMGMPDLLVLDEPTNGLDPQQIAEMRQVLRNYASTGRTVIISSHLLAEVQQTCTDVVLMHRGKLIAFGPMKKILKSGKKSQSLEEFFLDLIGDDLVIGKDGK
ncbi:MAG: hypothetical protein RL534_943 [Actinomycetota bacterium]